MMNRSVLEKVCVDCNQNSSVLVNLMPRFTMKAPKSSKLETYFQK